MDSLSARMQEDRAAERHILEQALHEWKVLAQVLSTISAHHFYPVSPARDSHGDITTVHRESEDSNPEDDSNDSDSSGGGDSSSGKAISLPEANSAERLCRDAVEIVDRRVLSRTEELFAHLGIGEIGTLTSIPNGRRDFEAGSTSIGRDGYTRLANGIVALPTSRAPESSSKVSINEELQGGASERESTGSSGGRSQQVCQNALYYCQSRKQLLDHLGETTAHAITTFACSTETREDWNTFLTIQAMHFSRQRTACRSPHLVTRPRIPSTDLYKRSRPIASHLPCTRSIFFICINPT